MNNTATLVIRIDTTTAKLRSELARAEREVARTAATIGKEAGRAESAIGQLGASLKGNLPGWIAEKVAAVVAYVGETLDEASALRKAADNVGIAIEQYQRLDYALKQAGLSQGQFDSALEEFLPNLEEVRLGGGEAAAVMQRLGVSVQDAGGKARTTDAVLLDVADGLAGIASPAERAALASQLFGETVGPRMAKALRQGGQALQDLGKDAIILEEDMVRSADEINKRWDELKNTIAMGLKIAVLGTAQAVDTAVDRINASLDNSARQRRTENLELARKSGRQDDIDDALEEMIKHGDIPDPNAAPKPAESPPQVTSSGSGQPNEPPAGSANAPGGNTENRKLEEWEAAERRRAAERAAAERRRVEEERRKEIEAARAEQVAVAVEYDAGKAGAQERGEAILRDKQALEDALGRELGQAGQAQKMSRLGEKDRRVETRLQQEQAAWQEKGLPLTETELEQKRAAIEAIVEFDMAAQASARTMEHLEQLGVNAFDRIAGSITAMAVQGKFDLDSLKSVGLTLVNELMKEFMMMAAINPLKNLIFGFDSNRPTMASFLGGFLDGFATGGRVSGPGTGTSDSILARLSNGEFVVNARATSQHLPLLEAINNGRLHWFANGGPVSPSLPVPVMPAVIPELRSEGGGMAGPAPVIHNHYDFSGANPATIAALRMEAERIKADTLREVPGVMTNLRRRDPARWR